MFLEQADSGGWAVSVSGGREYIRVFEADHREGLTLAISEGYIIGVSATIEGFPMVIMDVRAKPSARTLDMVEVVYRSPEASVSGNNTRDGRFHEEGDQEFYIEGDVDQMSAHDAIYSGFFESASSFPDDEDLTELIVDVPQCILVWKKWLPPLGGYVAPEEEEEEPTYEGLRTALPNTLAGAQALVSTYVNGTGIESNPPVINKRWSADPKFKVIDVRTLDDGALLLREARLLYRPFGEWPA